MRSKLLKQSLEATAIFRQVPRRADRTERIKVRDLTNREMSKIVITMLPIPNDRRTYETSEEHAENFACGRRQPNSGERVCPLSRRNFRHTVFATIQRIHANTRGTSSSEMYDPRRVSTERGQLVGRERSFLGGVSRSPPSVPYRRNIPLS